MSELLKGLDHATVKPKPPRVREFFRCERTRYMSGGSICETVKFRYLKRKSVREEQQGLMGHIDHYGEADTIGLEWGVLHFPEDPQHGAVYEAVFCPGTPDYETGICEDYHWELVEVTDESGK